MSPTESHNRNIKNLKSYPLAKGGECFTGNSRIFVKIVSNCLTSNVEMNSHEMSNRRKRIWNFPRINSQGRYFFPFLSLYVSNLNFQYWHYSWTVVTTGIFHMNGISLLIPDYETFLKVVIYWVATQLLYYWTGYCSSLVADPRRKKALSRKMMEEQSFEKIKVASDLNRSNLSGILYFGNEEYYDESSFLAANVISEANIISDGEKYEYNRENKKRKAWFWYRFWK